MNSLTSVDSAQGNESKNSKTYGTPPCLHIIYTVPYRKQTGNGPPMNEGVQQYVLHTKFGQTFLQILGHHGTL